MQILSHRGFWLKSHEKNSQDAFKRSFEANFGLETDIRDCYIEKREHIVVSHDIANPNCLKMNDFLRLYKNYSSNLPLALNIKADGLQHLLKELLEEYEISNYFVFDMSVPDGLLYLDLGFKVFTRQSEFEPSPAFYKKATGVWLDEFYSHFIDKKLIKNHLENDKSVCIVSPELHKREYLKEWHEYKEIISDLNSDKIMLCTDYPDKAKEFFDV